MQRTLCGLLALCLLFFTTPKAHAQELPLPPTLPADVLLVYDTPDLLSLTENILTAFNRTVDSLSIDDYQPQLMNQYRYIVALTPIPLEDVTAGNKLLCIGEGFELPWLDTVKHYGAGMEISTGSFYQYLTYVEEFSVIDHFQGESFGTVTMSFDREYPFAVKNNNLYYLPYLNGDNISTFALGELLPDFFESDYTGNIYVILEDVFAFSDLDMLCKTADELYLANIPFIVKVMPLYTNTDLDAFLRYTQVLRYVESRNGAIVLSPPIVNGKADDKDLAEMTATATEALASEGVTVLPSVEGFYFVDMDYLKEVKSPSKRYETFSFDVGILENLPTNDLQLKQMVANLNGRWYSFGNYRENFGQKTALFIEIPVDEALANRSNDIDTPLFFLVGNDILIILVSMLLLFILGLIYWSRVRYKRKFTRRGG